MQSIFESCGSIPRDLTAPYIFSVFADLEKSHHPFYTLLIRAPRTMVSIDQTCDLRTNKGYGESDDDPLCLFSAYEFLQHGHSFHKNDCFTISFDDSITVGTEEQFSAEVVRSFF